MPTLAIASDAFADLARQMATQLQIPEARIAIVPHPIGGTPNAELEDRAEASLEELNRLLA